MPSLPLPPFAPFPKASWQQHISSRDWDALSQAWIALTEAYLGIDGVGFRNAVGKDESVVAFVATFVEEAAGGSSSSLPISPGLSKAVFRLASRILTTETSSSSSSSSSTSSTAQLLQFDFLAGFAKIFPKKHTAPVLSHLFTSHAAALVESSLLSTKKLLIPQLDAGIKGDLKLVESKLTALNPLLHASPDACMLFLAGSDFFDGLVTCFRVMNPPLRKAITTAVYLCLVGLIEVEPPKWSMVGDQLFATQAAAEAHKKGTLNANDSLAADLVTNTPILKVLLRKAEDTGAASSNLKTRITALEAFKTGVTVRQKTLVKRKVNKGKGKGKETADEVHAEMHIHRMSKITHIQDIFPDLGAGFLSKCLDEFEDDEQMVVANLLSETLPSHLATADRTETLSHQGRDVKQPRDLAPRSTPEQLPARRNIFDDDDFDRLDIETSKISFGKNPEKTADDILKDKAAAPGKAAILSALATFDYDDDERDDTYDAADVGGTVDATNQEADGVNDSNEEVLFRAYKSDPKIFSRDAETRRGKARSKLRDDTGMSDEAIEGWAVMLARNSGQMRRLEAKYAWSGQQAQLERTAWRASPAGSGAEESDPDGGNNARGGGRGSRSRGRGRGRGGGGGRGGGNVAGPTGEKETESARRNKEANKSSKANHNRRDGRAKKMARGGFAG